MLRGRFITSLRPTLALVLPTMAMAAFFFVATVGGCRSTQQTVYQTQTPVEPATEASQPAPANYQYPSQDAAALSGAMAQYGPAYVPATVEAPPPSPIPAAPTESGPPTVTARAAILVDGFGRVLFEKNADARVPTASTQKLLLALLVIEKGNLSGSFTIEDADTWAEPTIMGIKPGQVYTREELLHAVLIRSCNDIARALARDHSGSEAAFVANVNAKARQLGMMDSYFTNSSGLPSPPGQYSTARDMAKLGMASLRNPVIRNITSSKSYVFRMADGTPKTLTNTNLVLRNFPYCTGLKTGTTNAAGKCLVSSASANGKTVVAVILGSTSPAVWRESEALLRYGLGM